MLAGAAVIVFSLLFGLCVLSSVDGYGLWFNSPSIIALDGVMVIPRKPSFRGTYYVWPGMEPSGGGGVLQDVCDGRSGSWWIGAGYYGTPSLPWGSGFSVNPYDHVTFSNVANLATGNWTCTLSKPNSPPAVSTLPLPGLTWSWVLLAVELYAPIGWDFGPVQYPTVSIQLQGQAGCGSLWADGVFGYFVGSQSSSVNSLGRVCTFNNLVMWSATANTLDFLNYLPTAAYSVRLLTQSYHGAALKVRRSSDSASLDIGFVNGLLDNVTLLNFVGQSDGYVVIWYDQSGNDNNAVQPNAGQQPKIVSAGHLVTAGDQASVLFNGASQDFLSLSDYPFHAGGAAAAYVVNSVRTVQSWQRYFDFGNGTQANVFATPTSGTSFRITVAGSSAEQGVSGQLLSAANKLNLAEFHHYGAPSGGMGAMDTVGNVNLGTHSSINLAPSVLDGVPHNYLGKSQYAADPYFDGWMSEVIFYNNDPYYVNVALQENAFHSSITAFYGI